MTTLTKHVLELEPGESFFKGEIKFTVLEMEEPQARPVLVGDSVVNVDCVAILLESDRGLVGWDHFPVGDTVCMISPSEFKAMQAAK